MCTAISDLAPPRPFDCSISSKSSYSDEKMMNQCAFTINDMLHTEINRISKNPYHFSTLSDTLKESNKHLINFFQIATQSARSRRLSTPVTDSTKLTKIAFLLSVLVNCTNTNILTPIHYVLSDILETSGGSRELMRLFNRLGCVSSPDSHDRYVTFHAENEQQDQLWNNLPPINVTLASVDNFDML